MPLKMSINIAELALQMVQNIAKWTCRLFSEVTKGMTAEIKWNISFARADKYYISTENEGHDSEQGRPWTYRQIMLFWLHERLKLLVSPEIFYLGISRMLRNAIAVFYHGFKAMSMLQIHAT